MDRQEHEVERGLAAIFAADAAGYSRLMSRDEVGTLHTLTAQREIMDRLITEHGSRTANTDGDSVLAQFLSTIDAVRRAARVQRGLASAHSSTPEEPRLQFRIGIHLRDAMVHGGDLLGNGVNIAPRLQGLSSPGGVCISGEVSQFVRKAPLLAYIDLRLKTVKNIDDPAVLDRL